MNTTMRRTLTLLLPLIWAVVIAQAPTDKEPAPAAEAGGQALPCVPATDAPQAPAANSGPLEGQPEGAEPVAVPCEQQAAEAEPGEEQLSTGAAGEIVAGPEATVEEDPDVEASAEDVFEPGDEISEDYPVPLPADI
jgi:hypothetical protein